jgi:hypothetical protein
VAWRDPAIVLTVAGSYPWLIDLRATDYELGELGKGLEETEIIGHNLKFDALDGVVQAIVTDRSRRQASH